MSKIYKERATRYYDKGIYDIEDVKVFVKSGDLTEEEFKEVTGEDYAE